MAYIGFSMSRRAAYAYSEGLKPLSTWKKNEIVQKVLEQYAAEPFANVVRRCSLPVLKEVFLEYREYHHTGARYNVTKFYGVIEFGEAEFPKLIEKINKVKEKVRETRVRKSLEAANCQECYVAECKYFVRKNFKGEGFEETATGIVKNDWFYLPTGNKKSTKARHFEILNHVKQLPVDFDVKSWQKSQNVAEV